METIKKYWGIKTAINDILYVLLVAFFVELGKSLKKVSIMGKMFAISPIIVYLNAIESIPHKVVILLILVGGNTI